MVTENYDPSYVYQAVCRITHLLDENLRLGKRQSFWNEKGMRPAWVREVNDLKRFLERTLLNENEEKDE